MNSYKITIGLNDKDTLKQEISTEKAISIIKQKMEDLKKGFSIKTLQGGYEMENGKYTFENSLELSIFCVDEDFLYMVCDEIKWKFNQECLLIVEIKEEAIFY